MRRQAIVALTAMVLAAGVATADPVPRYDTTADAGIHERKGADVYDVWIQSYNASPLLCRVGWRARPGLRVEVVAAVRPMAWRTIGTTHDATQSPTMTCWLDAGARR